MTGLQELEETPPSLPSVELTLDQREISAALDGERGTHLNDRPAAPSAVFWEVGLGILGIASLLVGVVLVFFFAALGSIVLVLGGMVCYMAFQGASTDSHRDGDGDTPLH
jgi:hypothetical protein